MREEKHKGNNDLAKIANRKPINNAELNEMARREESRLLSLILNNKECLTQVVEHFHVSATHFIHFDHCRLFQFICGYYTKYGGALVSRESFRAVLDRLASDPTEVSKYMSIFETFKTVSVSPDDLAMLMEGLVSRAAQMMLYNETNGGGDLIDIWKSKDSNQHINIRKLIDKMESALSSVTRTKDEFFSADFASSIADQFMEGVEKAKETPLHERAILCGIKCIDDEFLGFLRGKYMVILGFPNGGKTTMMLNFASNMARSTYKVGYVTVESSGKEVVGRLMSRRTGIPSKKFKFFGEGGMNDEYMAKLYDEKRKFDKEEGANLFIITVNQLTPITEILATVNKYNEAVGGFDVVFFDYLEVFGVPPKMKDKDRHLELTVISQMIQGWGKSRNILTVTAQSIKNTKIEEFRKKDFMEKVEKSDIFVGVENVGGAQAISRDADYVLAVVAHPRENKLVVYVTKARADGRANTKWVVGWNGATCDIKDITSNWCDSSAIAALTADRITPADLKKYDPKIPEHVSEIFQYFHRKGNKFIGTESSEGGEAYIEKIFSIPASAS